MSFESPELLVVMPVYNEEVSVTHVLSEWFQTLDSSGCDFRILVIDDGSRDSTPVILRQLGEELGPRLEYLRQENRGHGQTCIRGYHSAITRGIPYILQIDSDGQSDPRYFSDFWRRRGDLHVIYGKRTRTDGVRRIIASGILRFALRLVAGVDCVDANVPYRLMDTAACAKAILCIPPEFTLANVALAVSLRKCPDVRHGVIPIGFPPRRGGEPSVPFRKFAAKGIELLAQLRRGGIS